MDHIIINDLHACVNCLGCLEQDKFIIDVDTNVSIRDILRHLRRESNKCEIRLELSNMNVIKHCLIPLLKCSKDDSILFDLLIRLLMNLTQPAFICFKQQLPDDMLLRSSYIAVDESLKKNKLLFADEEILKILTTYVNSIFEKQWESRTEEEHMLVERILILMRNVLHINTRDDAIDGTSSDHDNLILAMLNCGWMELIMYLSSSDDEHRFAFHTLEIVSLMFKEQTTETMKVKKTTSASNKEEDNDELIRLSKLEAEKRERELRINTRALRFDGVFELPNVKTSTGRSMVYHHDLSSGNIDLIRNRHLRHKPRHRRPIVEQIREHKSAKPVLEKLQSFCDTFLEFGYNSLMSTARNYLLRQQMQPDDETYYLWALKFFTSICRTRGLTPDFVSDTMTQDVFHWVYEQAVNYRETAETTKKAARACYRNLQLTIGAYNEMLHFLLMLDRHPDKKYQELSAQIKSTVFYREEYMDLYPMLLNKFNETIMSRLLLRDLIEGSWFIIRILEKHKSFDMNVVRKLKKKRKAPKKKIPKVTLDGVNNEIVMPADNQEELLRIWDRISDVVVASVNGQVTLEDDHHLPCIYDATLPDKREPIEPGSEPVDVQLKKALGIVQIYLRREKALEAVALLRLARTMWPDEDRIALSEFDDSVTEEIAMLKTLLLAPSFYAEDDLEVVKNDEKEINEPDEEDVYDEEAENDEKDEEFVEQEVLFDLSEYLRKFTEPNIVKTYGILFNDIFTNPAVTNKSLLTLMYKIAIKMQLPVVLYQLRLFRAFSKFLKNPQSKTDQFKVERKFVMYMIRQFTKHATTNKKLFVEVLFSKNPRHLTNILTGEKIMTESKSLAWSESLDDELERLCDEVRCEEPLPGCDRVSMIMDRFSDPSKTRRQIVGRLINLGLMDSIKDFQRNKKRQEIPLTGEEQARLVVLVEEYKDQPNAIKFIMNGMKAAAEESKDGRSQRFVVKMILELGLVTDKAQLGIKSRPRKNTNVKESDDDEETDEEPENMYDDGVVREKRMPPPIKIRKIVDWTAFKMTFASLNTRERNWFVELLVDNIDTRANGIIGSLALIPLLDEDSDALSSKTMQKLLGICNFHCPDDKEQFWRIPEDMGGQELEYFRNCAASLSDAEIEALIMTPSAERTQPTEVDVVKLNLKEKRITFRDLLGGDSDTDDEDDEDSDGPRKQTRLVSTDEDEVMEKRGVRKSTGLFDSDEEEVDGKENTREMKSVDVNESYDEEMELKTSGRKSVGLFESDEEEDDAIVSLKSKRRILDSDDDDIVGEPDTKKKRMIDEDSD